MPPFPTHATKVLENCPYAKIKDFEALSGRNVASSFPHTVLDHSILGDGAASRGIGIPGEISPLMRLFRSSEQRPIASNLSVLRDSISELSKSERLDHRNIMFCPVCAVCPSLRVQYCPCRISEPKTSESDFLRVNHLSYCFLQCLFLVSLAHPKNIFTHMSTKYICARTRHNSSQVSSY